MHNGFELFLMMLACTAHCSPGSDFAACALCEPSHRAVPPTLSATPQLRFETTESMHGSVFTVHPKFSELQKTRTLGVFLLLILSRYHILACVRVLDRYNCCCRLEVYKNSLIEFWLKTRAEFPTISDMALNICLVFYSKYLCM